MKFDLEYLEKLANIIYDNDLSEITLEDEKQAVCLRRDKDVPAQITTAMPGVIPSTITSQIQTPVQKTVKQQESPKSKGTPVTAPMVGTFYSAPSPDDPPFVKVGDNIASGQVVCIIEAMKLMNEIETEVSGKITEICVKNGDNVEFGQILMYVE